MTSSCCVRRHCAIPPALATGTTSRLCETASSSGCRTSSATLSTSGARYSPSGQKLSRSAFVHIGIQLAERPSGRRKVLCATGSTPRRRILSSKTERLCQVRATAGVVRRHDWIVMRERPLRTIRVGRKAVLYAQMPLEGFERQTAFEAHDTIVTYRFAHWDGRHRWSGRLARIGQERERAMHVVDQAGKVRGGESIVADIGGYDPAAGCHQIFPVRTFCHSCPLARGRRQCIRGHFIQRRPTSCKRAGSIGQTI